MTQQTINIGTAANDGTGDQLRPAFDKVNDNFIEVYTGTAPVANTVVPVTAAGVTGDTAGMIAVAPGFIYTCHTTWTDGLSDIWDRVATATWV